MLRRFLNFVLFVIAIAGCTPSNDISDDRPNIVFILVDDLGKEWVGAYGAEDITTPNIDALAANGLRFDHAYAMPQCTPTRVTLLTGQYPFRHGWVNHWDVPRWGGGAHFDESMNPSIGMELKKAGYATCIAGKWQIDDFRVEPDALTRSGFDAYCMWTGYETGVPASAERYQEPYLFTSEGSKTYDGAFGPDVFTEYITTFIANNGDQPFFVYYPMVLTHPPLVDTPDESSNTRLGKHKAMVRYADKLTGMIVQSLEDAGVRENTLIIWTTDNGTSRGITGTLKGRQVNGGKSKTIEPGICVPFIASWPKRITSPAVSEALIDFTDLFPTFLGLAGIEVGDTWLVNGTEQPIDGRSFASVLREGTSRSQRDWIMSMGGGNHARLTEHGVENQFNYRDRVLRTERYKLYINSEGQPDGFFDLLMDPTETINLIDSLSTDERKKSFEALMRVVRDFPGKDSDPRYQPNDPQPWDVEVTAESQVWKK